MCHGSNPVTQVRDLAETYVAEAAGLMFGGSKGGQALMRETSKSAQASSVGRFVEGANKNYVYEKAVGALAGGVAASEFLAPEAAAPAAAPTVADASAPAAASTATAAEEGGSLGAGLQTSPAASAAPTAGSIAATKGGMSVAELIQAGAAIAGTAGAAASLYALKNAPKPPKPEDTPALPQAGKAPDYAAVSARTKKMFGDEGPFGGGTFLTGPGGVPASSVNVGRNILLGT